MPIDFFSDKIRLESAKRVLVHVAGHYDSRFSVRLWDGTMVPLGQKVNTRDFISINSPDVLSTILHHPSLENLVRLYALGKIDVHTDDLIAFMDMVRQKSSKRGLRNVSKGLLLKEALIFLLSSSEKIESQHGFNKDQTGLDETKRRNRDYIQFHYDVSNEFYSIFLDPEMQYSCAYFTTPEGTLEKAQADKLEHICRKLRLKAGETFLDIGCGWGGLICYAAQKYGVKAHGITLSEKQYQYTTEKIKKLGLEGQVTVEIRDYKDVQGHYDKIASIGMFEHIGLANVPFYFNKMNSLLRDRGLLLNHAITRRAKANKKKFSKIIPAMRVLHTFIFPGAELDHIGHTAESMETKGFEVRDVECLREHYAITTAYWYRRLVARKDDAVRLVGAEKYRLWIGYLAGVSLAFVDGSCGIYQTVAMKRASKGFSGLPMTRSDWYAA